MPVSVGKSELPYQSTPPGAADKVRFQNEGWNDCLDTIFDHYFLIPRHDVKESIEENNHAPWCPVNYIHDPTPCECGIGEEK